MAKQRPKVSFRGDSVEKGYPEALAKEQQWTHFLTRGGRVYRRIRYGDEGAADYPCHDCYALRGEIHLEKCDWERCPKCKSRLISCPCLWGQKAKINPDDGLIRKAGR